MRLSKLMNISKGGFKTKIVYHLTLSLDSCNEVSSSTIEIPLSVFVEASKWLISLKMMQCLVFQNVL